MSLFCQKPDGSAASLDDIRRQLSVCADVLMYAFQANKEAKSVSSGWVFLLACCGVACKTRQTNMIWYRPQWLWMETPPSPRLLGALNATWYDMTWCDMIWYYIGRPDSATSPAAGYLGCQTTSATSAARLPRLPAGKRVLGCVSGQPITRYKYNYWNCNEIYIYLQ
mgnify:CR=1 FL=1